MRVATARRSSPVAMAPRCHRHRRATGAADAGPDLQVGSGTVPGSGPRARCRARSPPPGRWRPTGDGPPSMRRRPARGGQPRSALSEGRGPACREPACTRRASGRGPSDRDPWDRGASGRRRRPTRPDPAPPTARWCWCWRPRRSFVASLDWVTDPGYQRVMLDDVGLVVADRGARRLAGRVGGVGRLALDDDGVTVLAGGLGRLALGDVLAGAVDVRRRGVVGRLVRLRHVTGDRPPARADRCPSPCRGPCAVVLVPCRGPCPCRWSSA